MPELPEVETTRAGIAPHLEGQTVSEFIVRQPSLRWPIPTTLLPCFVGHAVGAVQRRGKYLLLQWQDVPECTLLIHLGMSGSLRIVAADEPPMAHDHVDMVLANGRALRYCDPRRFGCWLVAEGDPLQHDLLKDLGPEPLSESFHADYLYARAKGRKVAVKQFLMDSHVVVGVGNIYANESLFQAGIHPTRAAGRISKARFATLVPIVKQVLQRSIDQGGTTLRDFVGGDGNPGYFKQSLQVYGRGGKPCRVCERPLDEIRLGQRTTVFCKTCQT